MGKPPRRDSARLQIRIHWRPMELPLEGMAFRCEATHPNFFEDSDGANVVIETLRGDQLDAGHLESPVDHPACHLGGIALPFIGGNDIVTNLHPACLVRRAVEADATDGYLVSFVENNAIPDTARWVLLHGLDKRWERFLQIGSRPGIRNRYPEQLR